MLILIGAHLFNPCIAPSHIPQDIGAAMTGSGLRPWGMMALIIPRYLVRGMFMNGFAMLVLTLPAFFPVVMAVGLDPTWFGVIVRVVLEMRLITPPVGMNVFIVHSVACHVPQPTIDRDVAPFWFAMMAGVVILSVFPAIATSMPDRVMGARPR